jgi:hypothetical protein
MKVYQRPASLQVEVTVIERIRNKSILFEPMHASDPEMRPVTTLGWVSSAIDSMLSVLRNSDVSAVGTPFSGLPYRDDRMNAWLKTLAKLIVRV